MAPAQIVAFAILIAGLVVALWLLIRRATGGRGRVPAAIGVVMILLGMLGRLAYQSMAERLLGRFDDATVVSALAAEIAIGGLLTGAGLLLIARAIVAAGRSSAVGRRPPADQR